MVVLVIDFMSVIGCPGKRHLEEGDGPGDGWIRRKTVISKQERSQSICVIVSHNTR